MASLEPPTRPYLAVGGPEQADSANTSVTHFEMSEAGGSSRIVEARLEPTSHEQPSSHEQPQIGSSLDQGGLGSEAEKTDDVPAPNPVEAQVPQTPLVYITFLVISGRRRTMTFEPETTLGRVKELAWNAWPSEWEDERPLAPSYLRVLYLGKMLQDDDTLSKLRFATHTPQSNTTPIPTIVHLSVRPFAPQNEVDLKKKRTKRRSTIGTQPDTVTPGEETTSAGCCGCIIC